MNPIWKERFSGIVLCIALGGTAMALSSVIPLMGGALCALILGVLIGPFKPSSTQSGVRFCESTVLKIAVAGMGFL